MLIGVIQMTSVLDFSENLKKIEAFLEEAIDKNVEAVFLPECFYSMSDGVSPTPYLVEENNEHYNNIKKLAKKFKIAILGGSAATLDMDKKIVNRCFNFDQEGNDLGHYDKIHLFSCDITKNNIRKKIDEGNIYQSGKMVKMISYNNFKIGLGICFDLRFSEMAQSYVADGANLLTFSSAFTIPTGRAHWHILNRARAIENQCFVVAPAQWGMNNDKISTYGHSLIIDPWGEVLADAKDGEKLITANIDLNQITEVRNFVHMRRT